MNILHLVEDEKFIDFFARTMPQKAGINHRYIVQVNELNRPLRHIQQMQPFRCVDSSYFTSKLMQQDLMASDVLVVHFMTLWGARMIRSAPSHVKIVWSGWGADYYHLLPGGEQAVWSSQTREIASVIDKQRAQKNFAVHARRLLRPWRRLYLRETQLIPALKKVNFFSAPLPEDYYLLRRALGNAFRASFVQINYGSVEETFAIGSESVDGENILVGNSATLTNNHIEIFRLLAKHNLSGRKVIVPLSYGDSDYRQIILELGQDLLGESFMPLVNFMPLAEYNRLTGTCSIAIMNHYRQQALGNIGSILYRGAKLFLSNKNVAYGFLRAKGAHVCEIGDLESGSSNAFSSLTREQKADNVKALHCFWGQEKVSENATSFINALRSEPTSGHLPK